MANYKVTDIELASIANAIRTKGGTSAQLEFPDEFVSAIQAISTSSSGGIGSYVRGTLVGEYDNRSPSSGGVGGAWTSTGYDTSDDIGYIVDLYYNDNLIKSTLILKDKVLPSGAPNMQFENFGAELSPSGGLYDASGFNVKIENSILIVSFGATGNNEYSAKVYTADGSSDGNLYTNVQIYSQEEQITDVSGFTLLYNGDIAYGNLGQKVSARLAITDESAHSTLQDGGWNANGMAFYDTENLIGAYGGYDFGQGIPVTKAKFWLSKFVYQNKTLIATIEYLDENGNWNEIQDLEITANMSYPSYVFEVPVNRSIYGIRWIHKKEPIKTTGNNIIFAGMSVYHGIGQTINVYIPESSGLNMPPTGYDGFGPVMVGNKSPSEITPSLPSSDQSKILASAYPANYSDDNPNWGGLTISKTNNGLIKNPDFIYLRNNSMAMIDLGEPNHSFVAYFVGLALDGGGQWPVLIGNWYDNSTNNSIALCTNGTNIAYTHYGNTIAVTSFYGIKLFVGAIRVDGTNKLSSCFINGEQIAQSTPFNNSGQYCTFGAFVNLSYPSNSFIKYLAVVDGVENDSTIISNQQHLMILYGIE